MVGNDQCDTELTCARRSRNSGNATVDGDDQLRRFRMEALHRLDRQTVALVETAGDKRRHVGTERSQSFAQHGRCADTIRIVIAVDHDALPGSNRSLDQRDRLRCIAER